MMSKQHLTILQLEDIVDPSQWHKVYNASRARYLRLTARGPLRFYRRQLLSDLDRAYQTLKTTTSRNSSGPQSAPRPNGASCPTYAAARRNAHLKNSLQNQLPNQFSLLKKIISSSSPSPSLPSRNLDHWRQPAPSENNTRRQDLIEDEFCREVIYRLEGDLIRFDSRRQLLQLASERNIHTFRANMLIAQIVETVRQNKLYLPSPKEISSLRSLNASLKYRKSPRPSKPRKPASRSKLKPTLTALIILLALIIDLLLIHLLDN
jgi:hypothetical protein